METKRLAGFLHRTIDLHVVVVMYGLVAHRRYHEPDDVGMVAKFLDRLQRRMRVVERDEEHRLHLRIHGQNVFTKPLVVGAAQQRFHIELRMHAEVQHRCRKDDHVIEMEGFNGTADQRYIAVNRRIFHDFAQLRLMRHAATDILIPEAEIAVQAIGRTTGAVLQMIQRHRALHVVLDVFADRRPGFDFHVMGIGIDDDNLVEIVELPLELAMREDVPRIGLGRDFLDRDFAEGFDACVHGKAPRHLFLSLNHITPPG